MEANFFRCLARELAPRMEGRRVEKIFNPAPGVWTFKVRTRGGGSFVLTRSGTRGGTLFLTAEKPANPSHPGARCMWLRKRVSDRVLGRSVVDWPGRSIAFELPAGGEGRWLVLSARDEPRLLDGLPPGFGEEPAWPEAERALADAEAWREYPQLTPPLRRLLAASPEGRAEAVLDAVRRGGCSRFFLYEGKGAPRLLAWRLPDELRTGLDETAFDSAVDAADAAGRSTLFPFLHDLAEADGREALAREAKRLRGALKSIDRDRERLGRMAALAEDAEALRGVLWAHGKDDKLTFVDVPLADGSARRMDLDPRLTVAGNMERLFKRAAKGRRGLEFVAGREKDLQAMLAEVERGRMPEEGERRIRARRGADAPVPKAPKGVAVFRTSDGFTALRGKNAAGNRAVRVAASPFDLWFHARGGPGAHVVLRRDYPDQELPERSLEEAAALAGLRSFAAALGRAEVICALLRHVHSVKGAGPGTVTVGREYAALEVVLDPDLEERLAAE